MSIWKSWAAHIVHMYSDDYESPTQEFTMCVQTNSLSNMQESNQLSGGLIFLSALVSSILIIFISQTRLAQSTKGHKGLRNKYAKHYILLCLYRQRWAQMLENVYKNTKYLFKHIKLKYKNVSKYN